ncbi:baseplate multidomain protein megatron [Aerobium aerolatum]|uniref:Phage tail protein n=1 Tax=Aquamicrobium aerolatum DSM 21857 TaxID=1121003 RepID=A0A1I3JLR2_9HYPH|nr:glycoside hydrolase/phage tail family protein [Aquamicrobium aerolatum]SFI61183.1 Putative phage tail protein [Aquamicrobium aerolatum DSM 21857]
MATILLQAAGSYLGGVLGPVGAALGAAAGSMAGYMVDRALLQGSRHIEGNRLSGMQPFQAEEGAPVARVYGTMRVGGNVIWATRFEEASRTERQGGKGITPKVTTYSYFCNAAFALCEGEIAGVRRIWADGREVDLDQVTIRIYRGSEDQPVDPLVAAKQGAGNAPAYRGIAYAVLDRFPLGDYGNRIPQLQFEVMRPVGEFHRQIRSVALLPGATEYGLLPRAVVRTPNPGETVQVNRHVLHGPTDLVASLDELQALCPKLEEVAVIVTWFGDDLRAGQCLLRPAVIDNQATDYSEPWSVAGVDRADAINVSYVDGSASYGGTPSDRSVIECIAELKRRGLRVMLYPFLMMDIAPDNSLPNPYGGASQPPYPWRGRITCEAGNDKSGAARSEVNAFSGTAQVGHFSVAGEEVSYSGPANDWGYRRLVLHYAHLAVAAGGVDGFLLGSEMRGLTALRDGANAFPFVETLCALAGEVRGVLGAGSKITYGADWSEYFGHQPPDGSGDVFFHLDALWAHPAVDAVGIDNYMPISDWRDSDHDGQSPDGFREPYDRAGMRGQIAAGEGFDWYYASAQDRADRVRSPISDGAYGKPWTYRYKDLRGWWENRHFNRIGGVEVASPTAWVPRSKPIWFTELGCPAVDKGANQPNVFPDGKSSENASPYYSSGQQSDLAQQRMVLAHVDYWDETSAWFDPDNNPLSPLYGGRMVDASRLCLWAWDARPFPAFPQRSDVWRDNVNWRLGHWLNGRVCGVAVGDLIAAILEDHGLPEADVSLVGRALSGFLVAAPTTARAALEALTDLHGIGVFERGGQLVFRDETAVRGAPVAVSDLVLDRGTPVLERTRLSEEDVPREAELSFVDHFREYQTARTRATPHGVAGAGSASLTLSGALDHGLATALVSDWVQRRWVARETLGFGVPASALDIEPGALIALPGRTRDETYLVTDVEIGLVRQVSARRVARRAASNGPVNEMPTLAPPPIAGAPHVVLLNLPEVPGSQAGRGNLRIAAYARPWRTQAVYASPEDTGFVARMAVEAPATLGRLTQALEPSAGGPFDEDAEMEVKLLNGALESVSMMQLANGANSAAVRTASGAWEVVQFADAEEIASSTWKLTGLLRGQAGTGSAALAGANVGADFVLLNSAVPRIDLSPDEVSLALHWRIGPAGHDFGSGLFARLVQAGAP